MFGKILGNGLENFWECSRRLWGMFGKIPGNVHENLQGMFKKILRYVWKDSIRKWITGNIKEDSGEF